MRSTAASVQPGQKLVIPVRYGVGMMNTDTLDRVDAIDPIAVATATLAAAGIAAVAVAGCPDPTCPSCGPVDQGERRHGDGDRVAA